jgi:hypothetical protein
VQVRDEAPNLKYEAVIMYCLFRAVTHIRKRCGTMIEFFHVWGKWKTLG